MLPDSLSRGHASRGPEPFVNVIASYLCWYFQIKIFERRYRARQKTTMR